MRRKSQFCATHSRINPKASKWFEMRYTRKSLSKATLVRVRRGLGLGLGLGLKVKVKL